MDGLNSVVVGFNAHFGPGEYRGIYEFDLRQLPACDGDLRMTLRLSLVGSAFEGIDPNLTLFAGPGDGALGAADFASGGVVTEFSAFDAAPFNDIDVTRRCGFVRHQLVPPRRPNAYGWVGPSILDLETCLGSRPGSFLNAHPARVYLAIFECSGVTFLEARLRCTSSVRVNSIARSARCLRPPSGSDRAPRIASRGPRTRNSISHRQAQARTPDASTWGALG